MRAAIYTTVLASLLPMQFSMAGVKVILHGHATQSNARLRLEDVATVSGDLPQRETLRRFVLPAKGRPGDTVTYGREELTQWLQRQYVSSASPAAFAGAGRVVVYREVKELPADAYIETASQALEAQLADLGERIEMAPSGRYRNVRLPNAATKLTARVADARVRSQMMVWVDAIVNGERYTSIPVAFRVHWWRDALVVRASLQAKTALTPKTVALETIDAARTRGEVLIDVKTLEGKRLKHDMNERATLRESDLEEIPPVAAGEPIEVFARVGHVIVRTAAVAARDGHEGERIRAHLNGSSETLDVRVIGKGQAVVGSL